MCKVAAVACLYLTTKVLGVGGFRFSACEFRNVQQRFRSLKCRVPHVMASHAATRLLRIFLFSVQNASVGRVLPSSLSTIPMVHYSSTCQEAQIGLYRFPEKRLMVHEKLVSYVGPLE
jgi:hypothetical protein